MWRVVFLSVIQSSLLAGGQVFLKFALQKMQPFGWTRAFWYSLLLNWHYPLSVAYPMISLSYVLGLLAAILFFHESVSVMKWVGVGLIVLGCCLIAK